MKNVLLAIKGILKTFLKERKIGKIWQGL